VLSLATSEWIEKDGLLQEPRMTNLGLRHGFTTRRSGNMKFPEKRAAAAALVGLPEPLTLNQVHGTVILDAEVGNAGKEADGWLLSKPGLAVAIYVADCVPLFLWSDDGKAAGVFHAGWRGTAKKMAQAAVAAFRERLGILPKNISAATGPHIAACCYGVGPEVAKDFPESSLRRLERGLFLDLATETRRQLVEAGVEPAKIGAPAPCTLSHPDDFFSFRRDKDGGRLMGFVGLGGTLP
jgi:polyphenol oxidase